MNGWCSLNESVELARCDSCAFGGVHCLFYHEVEEKARRHLKHDEHVWKKNLQIMKQRLAEKNAKKRAEEEAMVREARMEAEKLAEEMKAKQKAIEEKPVKDITFDVLDYGSLASVVLVSFALGFPLAYIGQLLQSFAELLFDTIGLFTGSGAPDFVPAEQSWFYADFKSRYIYWTALTFCLAMWTGIQYKEGKGRNTKGVVPVCELFATIIYAIAALMFFNLFVGTIFGPIIIVIGLIVIGRRR